MQKIKEENKPFSIDANVLHSSAEGKVLEDPFVEAPEYVYTRSVSPFEAPNEIEEVTIDFKSGDACALMEKPYLLIILEKLNTIGGKHGVGRIDLS